MAQGSSHIVIAFNLNQDNMNSQQTINENAIADLFKAVDSSDIKGLLSEMFMTYIQQPEYRGLEQMDCNSQINTYSHLQEFINKIGKTS